MFLLIYKNNTMNRILSMHPIYIYIFIYIHTSTGLQQYCCLNGTSKLSPKDPYVKHLELNSLNIYRHMYKFYVVIESFTTEKCSLPPISMMKNALLFEFPKIESIWFKNCLWFPHAVPMGNL